MNVKTMEGLTGAGASISLLSTPMNVAKEAESKGDTDKMQRAMGYAAGLKEQAEDYGEKASQGMKLEAKEWKEQEKLQREKLIEARKEEQKTLEKQNQKNAAKTEESDFDSAKISSQEGKDLAQMAGQTPAVSMESIGDVTYGKSGTAAEAVQEAGENVNVTA